MVVCVGCVSRLCVCCVLCVRVACVRWWCGCLWGCVYVSVLCCVVFTWWCGFGVHGSCVFVCVCISVGLSIKVSTCVCEDVCVYVCASVYIVLSLYVFRHFHRLHVVESNDQRDGNRCCPGFDGRLRRPSSCPNADDNFDGCEAHFRHDLHKAFLLDFSKIVEMTSSH